jgi:anti-anti-sigma factor
VAGALINTYRASDGSAVVEIRGEIDVSSADRLSRILVDIAHRLRPARVVVDLLYLTFIDSSGMGALVAGRNAARAVGIGFTVRQPSPFVTAQLQQTGLYNTLMASR